jgi:hypothetical protein
MAKGFLNEPKGPNPFAGDSKVKHSSAGPEREMRKEATSTPEQARQKHTAQDTKQHPALRGNTTKG